MTVPCGHQFPTPAVLPSGLFGPGLGVQQLALIGLPQPVRVPERWWRSWLDDPGVVARFEAKCYRRTGHRCTPWVGAVSSDGYGSFRAGSLPGPTRRGTVSAHLFAYQLAYGVIPRLGWVGAPEAVVCHQCDFAGCVNPTHLRLGTPRSNRVDYLLRRHRPASPLADVRGPAGRTRAIAAAIRAGHSRHEGPELIEDRIRAAQNAGMPLTLW